MHGASLTKQQENLQKQIEAFEYLVQRTKSHFPQEKLFQMLSLASQFVSEFAENAHEGSEHLDPCIGTLGKILLKLQSGESEVQLNGKLDTLKENLDEFFTDLEVLKNLKKYFDERIYTCLYKYFYDPEVNLKESTEDCANQLLTTSNDNGSFRCFLKESQWTESSELMDTIDELHTLNKKWELLCLDDDTRADTLSIESCQETLEFPSVGGFEFVLRAVNGIFAKCQESMEKATIWWQKASNVYEMLPGKTGKCFPSIAETEERIIELNKIVQNIDEEIEEEEETLNLIQEDLSSVEQRDRMCDELESDCKAFLDTKSHMTDEYLNLTREIETLQARLGDVSDDEEFAQLESSMKELNADLARAENRLTLTSFKCGLLLQDLQVKMTCTAGQWSEETGSVEVFTGRGGRLGTCQIAQHVKIMAFTC